jgi:hypothetical protein
VRRSGKAVAIAKCCVGYNAAMPSAQPQRRRWFRFSLRTFLVAFTAVAVWLGWRKDFIASLPWPYVARAYPEREARPPSVVSAYQLQAKFEAVLIFIRQLDPPPSERTWAPTAPHATREPTASGVPWIRRLLGDTPYYLIAYYPGPSMDRASALFPEATILVADKPWPWPGIKVSEKAVWGWTYEYADRLD